MKILTISLAVLFLFSCKSRPVTYTISSPSGNIKTVITIESKKVFYSIASIKNGVETIVLPSSPLGVERNDGSFYNNLRIDSITAEKEVSDSYEMVSGKEKHNSYKAREGIICLSNKAGQKMQIVFRLFDDGVAFRYVFPERSDNIFSILSEKTGFQIPETASAWMSPYERTNNNGQPGYEKDYLSVKPGTVSPDSIGWALPVLFKKDNYWFLISESGLNDSYCGSHLDNTANNCLYSIAFPIANERFGKGNVNPSSKLPWSLPWRYIIIGNSVSQVYESGIGYHLAEPCKLDDVLWIKPGRSSWEWWSSTSGRTVKKLKEFIDLAAEMQWEYTLVDAGWENMPDGTVEEVISYAKRKNINVNLWYNSGGRRNKTSKNDEDFIMFNERTRNTEMARIKELGIKGIKVDFFSSDKQDIIRLYLDILRDAAKHQLVVNFHGCTMPRGWTRTYPNLLTMEAIKGAENYRYDRNYPDMAARFNTVAAIVRGAAGPTDYTPVTITNQKYPHKTTISHQLALAVIYESGIIHMADKPEGYLNLPREAKEFLKKVPAAWDETKLIEAIPGELFVVARKKEGKWFVAGINGKNEPGEITIKLPEAMQNPILMADGESSPDLQVIILKGDQVKLKLKMKTGGGFILY